MNSSSIIIALLLAVGLPKSVDNSTVKYFPPIIHQLGGSCAQASYIGYMYTYEWNRYADTDASSSPDHRFSYFYTWNFINDGIDQGSYGYDALQLCMSNGVMTESDFPAPSRHTGYKWMSGYDKYYRAMQNRLLQFHQQPLSTEEDLDIVKRYLYNHGGEDGRPGGVVTFSTYAANWKMDNDYQGPSETGYHCLQTGLATTGGHALTIVGYDDLVEFSAPDGSISKGAFIVCNTWGELSHDRGRYYMPYWFFLQPRDEEHFLSPEVCMLDVDIHQPEITFKVGVDCDKRNNLCFTIGAAEGLVADVPTTNYRVGIANHQGGGYCMQGAQGNSDIEFGFDFSNAVRFIGGYKDVKYFLTVCRQSKDGSKARKAKLTSFSVLDYRKDPGHPVEYRYEVPAGGIELEGGNNVFYVTTGKVPEVSCSPVKWLTKDGTPASSPMVIRTAKGRYAKIRMYDYDRKKGTIKIKYVYSPSGDRNLE